MRTTGITVVLIVVVSLLVTTITETNASLNWAMRRERRMGRNSIAMRESLKLDPSRDRTKSYGVITFVITNHSL